MSACVAYTDACELVRTSLESSYCDAHHHVENVQDVLKAIRSKCKSSGLRVYIFVYYFPVWNVQSEKMNFHLE